MTRHSSCRAILASLLLAVTLALAPFACGPNDSSADARSTTGPAVLAGSKKPTSKPIVAKWTQRPLPANQVNLLAFGDWGNGKPSQKADARTMATYVESTGLQFNGALTAGDNFYVKLKNVDDWQFQALFEDMYDAKILNFPFFASMGNHDYEKADAPGNKIKADLEREYAALHPDSRWKCPARWYRVDFPLGSDKPLVTALLLESNKPRMSKELWEAQKAWIDAQLAQTPAKWKIACAHHPFFSNGSHGDNGVLQVEWGPIFKKRGLDFYVAGHDHDLQHLQIKGWPISFVQAGGGGQPITDMRRDLRGPFSRKLYGFAHLQFIGDQARVRYIASGPQAKIVHQFVRDKETGEVQIVSTTGHDRATTKPLKTLLGIGEKDVKPKTAEKK